ncbi:helix-turn-helix transcriptional regulator [Haematobacter genomosp. 1]|uniref:AlpA family transcriptional regulator n=1 Tax=Haematobacter genomosp. 1 TaxID=366618 RepID=A0A212A8I7_9RHOB|nr:AlpA family phage regulatory protein [Haematobacter genomosp. 1]OWJ76174.1 hypothetical protein CDV49_15295 [Haematobacter genomosp. 1]
MSAKIYRLPAVIEMTGMSRASIYLGVKRKTFPAPVKLSTRSVGWTAESIAEWVKSRPAAVA